MVPVPFVTLAVLCESAQQNADGTLTISRILDEISVATRTGPALPAIVPVTAVVAIRAADAAAHGDLVVIASDPSNATAEVARFPAALPAHANLARVLTLRLQIVRPGDYSFDVTFNGTVLSRMRLAVHVATAH
jgi:hypothetical protein